MIRLFVRSMSQKCYWDRMEEACATEPGPPELMWHQASTWLLERSTGQHTYAGSLLDAEDDVCSGSRVKACCHIQYYQHAARPRLQVDVHLAVISSRQAASTPVTACPNPSCWLPAARAAVEAAFSMTPHHASFTSRSHAQ